MGGGDGGGWGGMGGMGGMGGDGGLGGDGGDGGGGGGMGGVGERHREGKVLCPRTQHIDSARPQTCTSQPGVQCTNK